MSSVTVELTDGATTKPVNITRDCGLNDLLKLSKNKLRKRHKHCSLYDKSQQRQYAIRNDDDLCFVLEKETSPCFYFSNKLPEFLEELDKNETPAAVCFIIGNSLNCSEDAISQLKAAAQLPKALAAIGMPDLHVGKGVCIGAALITAESVAYPQLVDTDIGCGMSFVETGLTTGKLSTTKLRKIADNLESIDGADANVEVMKELCEQPLQWAGKQCEPLPELPSDEHYMKLGTIGGGNHFVELQEFVDVMDAEALRVHGIDATKVHLLVHSGSRSLGAEYLQQFCDKAKSSSIQKYHGHFGVETDSEIFQEYLENHSTALNFAIRNRQLIAKRLLDQLPSTGEGTCKIDIHHNFLEQIQMSQLDVLHQMGEEQGLFPKRILTSASSSEFQKDEERLCWIHRKGATPTTQSPILVIPGSRGTLSYLVEVNQKAMHGSAYSLAHGAGRQMTRAKARSAMSERFSKEDLLQTPSGGIVVCDKKDLIYEEAPSAYKDIDGVVRCMAQDVCAENGGLVRILATLRPLLTYKYKTPY